MRQSGKKKLGFCKVKIITKSRHLFAVNLYRCVPGDYRCKPPHLALYATFQEQDSVHRGFEASSFYLLQ